MLGIFDFSFLCRGLNPSNMEGVVRQMSKFKVSSSNCMHPHSHTSFIAIMKSTKVQTHGKLCMHGTANSWVGL